MLAALVIVACVAIVFITDYMRRSHQAEIDATLKNVMGSFLESAARQPGLRFVPAEDLFA